MKVHELIALLQTRHPDAHVEIQHNAGLVGELMDMSGYDYVLCDIHSVGDWANPGGADDLVTINAGAVTGC